MKEYPLTKGEMFSLAGIGVLATLCFSGAAASFGFWVNVSMSLAMSDKLSEAVKAQWTAYKDIALTAVPILSALGVIFLLTGGISAIVIMKSTRHD